MALAAAAPGILWWSSAWPPRHSPNLARCRAPEAPGGRWEGSSPGPLGMNGGKEKLQPLDFFIKKRVRGVVHHKVLGVVKELKLQKTEGF